MTKIVKLKRGLDIPLIGKAEARLEPEVASGSYAVNPSDFQGVIPKMLVKVGDSVKAGSPLFFDKNRPELIFTSPVSGEVSAINRGDKRKILNVTIAPTANTEYEMFDTNNYNSMSDSEIKTLMLNSGLWPLIIQRPYGVIANEKDTPRDIFVSLFDSAPLGADLSFILEQRLEDFARGVEVLKRLTTGGVYFGASPMSSKRVVAAAEKNGTVTTFVGKHPAGVVGVQINNSRPIAKGDTVWTVDAQSVAIIGAFFGTGKVDMSRIIAVCGSEVEKKGYFKTVVGAEVAPLLKGGVKSGNVRVISGNVLTGTQVGVASHTSFYANTLTVIPEGDNYEFVGWIAPRFGKFSLSKSYFSWLTPKKEYRLDTNCNGDERAYVMSGEYEKVLPMDIYPVYLIKAILAKDIDKMENLGIYEVIEEDFALCEFVCTSKIAVQQIIRDGINLMIKELN